MIGHILEALSSFLLRKCRKMSTNKVEIFGEKRAATDGTVDILSVDISKY